ncbi:MAG TPA: DUF2868 domain-containing protein [Burkholderiaceae bacterium]|nr:DUF2868 domain-containing protein [Burkholderiaceae bacterium]
MNEAQARDVLLVRAFENADTAMLTDDDRRHASRAAAELTRWRASERGAPASIDAYIAERAQLLAGKLRERDRHIARTLRALNDPSWLGIALPVLALLVGAFVEHVTDRTHINVLAFPLVGLLIWNVVVYAVLFGAAVRRVFARFKRKPSASNGTLWRMFTRRIAVSRGPSARVLAMFVADWTHKRLPLMQLRAARVMHLAAACLALGAIVGLYVRGLVFDYRAGWESTFLSASNVHALLSAVLSPAAHALQELGWHRAPFPNVEAIAALRFEADRRVGENAASWIHWYAFTLAVVVIVPRLMLFVVARWRERRWSRVFPLDLNEPYFRRMTSGFASRAEVLRVVPYGYTPDEASLYGVKTVATLLLGDDAQVLVSPVIALGDEASAYERLTAPGQNVAMTIALFNLAATPEHEHHGAMINALRQQSPRHVVAVLVDEASYRKRFQDAVGTSARVVERRQAWRGFCAAYGVAVTCVDLTAIDPHTLERELNAPFLAEPLAAR